MALVLLLILILGLYFIIKDDSDLGYILFVISGFLLFFVLVAAVIQILGGFTAKDKIKMYEEENKNIENQISIVVKDYMNYEKETLKEFKNENAITYVNLYPELKANTLVQKQVEIYLESNKKIKELKESQIDMKIGKWLLYFGG